MNKLLVTLSLSILTLIGCSDRDPLIQKWVPAGNSGGTLTLELINDGTLIAEERGQRFGGSWKKMDRDRITIKLTGFPDLVCDFIVSKIELELKACKAAGRYVRSS